MRTSGHGGAGLSLFLVDPKRQTVCRSQRSRMVDSRNAARCEASRRVRVDEPMRCLAL
jgi:hypothetical protein